MGLKTLLGLSGEDLTIEDYETAFEATKLVKKSLLDDALKSKGDLTKENRAYELRVKELEIEVAELGDVDKTESQKMQDQLTELKRELLIKDARALFMDNGFDSEYAETVLGFMKIDEDLTAVNDFITLEVDKREKAEKAAAKEAGKVPSPKTPENPATTKEKLKERFEKLLSTSDVQGVSAFKQDHPEEFKEFTTKK